MVSCKERHGLEAAALCSVTAVVPKCCHCVSAETSATKTLYVVHVHLLSCFSLVLVNTVSLVSLKLEF